MPCPQCQNKDDRLIVKNGSVYRKKKAGSTITPKGAKIKRCQCTVCGYTGRASKFGLPETEEEELVTKESPEDRERRLNGNILARIIGRPDIMEEERK